MGLPPVGDWIDGPAAKLPLSLVLGSDRKRVENSLSAHRPPFIYRVAKVLLWLRLKESVRIGRAVLAMTWAGEAATKKVRTSRGFAAGERPSQLNCQKVQVHKRVSALTTAMA